MRECVLFVGQCLHMCLWASDRWDDVDSLRQVHCELCCLFVVVSI